jgi:Protein of unknown function (DUF1800)
MGQDLFEPPNVKGWPGGTSWLNTSTILERDNFAEALSMGTLWPDGAAEPTDRVPASSHLGQLVRKLAGSTGPKDSPEEPAPPRAFDPARILDEAGVGRPEDVVGALLDRCLPGGVRPEVRAKLVAFVADGHPAGPALARRVREAVHAILTTSEYQLA